MTTTLLLWARAFHFGSGMILVGVVAFRWLVLLPAFAGEADETWQTFRPFCQKLHALFIGSVVILVASGAALFWAVAAGMSGSSLTGSLTVDTLRSVLFQTRFGQVCQWRLGLVAILCALMWRLARNQWLTRRKSSPLEVGAGLVAIALVVSVAWTGHAAATGGPDFWPRVLADASHLLTTSIWPTGLLPFALFLGASRKIDHLAHLQSVLMTACRFSTVSFLAVWILIATGMINSYFIVGSFQALIATDYGRLLCLKLSLFLVMLGIAAWNRYRLLPLLLLRAEASGTSLVWPLVRRLQSFVLIEFSLALAVVGVVSFLGITPPPH
ncbi:MAG: CopD family protein [Methylacidiphilales bacterium]|nr:CopD family protein [Candidatus Methylacidiphilales bacterium]